LIKHNIKAKDLEDDWIYGERRQHHGEDSMDPEDGKIQIYSHLHRQTYAVDQKTLCNRLPLVDRFGVLLYEHDLLNCSYPGVNETYGVSEILFGEYIYKDNVTVYGVYLLTKRGPMPVSQVMLSGWEYSGNVYMESLSDYEGKIH